MKKVLIIDDSLFTLQTHSGFVRSLGLTPIVAEGGEEAISQYQKMKPEIVLCDIMMPEMDGYEVFDALKKLDPHVFLYFISAEMTEQAQAKAVSMNAAGFFQKPITAHEIKLVLEHYEAQFGKKGSE